MPYAIELYLDDQAATAIAQIHFTLRRNGIKVDEGTKPHVSLCIYEDLPIGETERPVVFLAPQAASELLAAVDGC